MSMELISVIILIAGFIVSLAKILWPLVKANLTATQVGTLTFLIKTAIFAAEQLFKEVGKGKEKKEFVIDFIMTKFPTMIREEVEVLVEGVGKELGIFKEKE